MPWGVRNYLWGKTMSDADAELGPVDYLVVAFPAGKADFSGADGVGAAGSDGQQHRAGA